MSAYSHGERSVEDVAAVTSGQQTDREADFNVKYDTVRTTFVVMLTVGTGGGLFYSHFGLSVTFETETLPSGNYEINDRAKWLSNTCNHTFKSSFDDNLQVIKNYPKGVADRYFSKIGGNKSIPDTMMSFPVFVTAMDYAYYPFCQGMFYTLHTILNSKEYKGKSRIIVYDLGLSKRQLRVLQKKCRCEIRRFPFELFPPHVRNLHTYAFKPLVVQMTLMEFGFVWWTDISVKFVQFNLDDAIDYARRNSMLYFVEREHPLRYSIAQQTDIGTFKYLEEDICKFRFFGEARATTALFHFDDTTKVVVNAWASCALNKACIAPVGKEKLTCDIRDQSDGRCHRFDQSALGIILRRLYHEQNEYPLDRKLNKIYFIGRREFVNYFERCRIEYTCY